VPTAAVIDSQTVRAADTVPTASSGYDGGKKIKGRKRHVAVDTGGLLLAVVVMTASLQDRDGAFRSARSSAVRPACPSSATWEAGRLASNRVWFDRCRRCRESPGGSDLPVRGRRARVRGLVRVGQDFRLLAAAVNLARLATLGLRHTSTGWQVQPA
jgi:hypothetical protein